MHEKRKLFVSVSLLCVFISVAPLKKCVPLFHLWCGFLFPVCGNVKIVKRTAEATQVSFLISDCSKATTVQTSSVLRCG